MPPKSTFHARGQGNPHTGQYAVAAGIYYFAAADAWKEVLISYRYEAAADGKKVFSEADRRQRLSKHFFKILGLLPQNHIVHDTAIGLQLPESNNREPTGPISRRKAETRWRLSCG